MVTLQVKERTMPRILITESLAQAGLDLLRRELPEALVDQRIGLTPTQLRAVLGDYTVLIVDGDTRVTDELLAVAPRLQLIGRAGSEVDNIDLEAAGRRGVLVVHAREAMCQPWPNIAWPCCWHWCATSLLQTTASRLADGSTAAL